MTSMISDEINDMLSRFKDKIKELENKHVPIIELMNKKKYAFPIDKNTRNKRKEKNRLEKKYVKSKNPLDTK